jgi:hypothetical protein
LTVSGASKKRNQNNIKNVNDRTLKKESNRELETDKLTKYKFSN